MNKKNLVIFLTAIIFITIFFLIYKKIENKYQIRSQLIYDNIQKNNIEKISADKTINWSVYSSPIYRITFKHPVFWNYSVSDSGGVNDSGVSGDKGEMIFISSFLESEITMDDIVYDEINQRMQPYGAYPVIEKLQINGQEGRLIISESFTSKDDSYKSAALIIKYPKPIKISEVDKNYLLINFGGIDLDLIKEIIKTIDFYNLKI